MRFRLTTILLACCSLLFAQQEATDLRRGNKQYNDSNYTEAEVNYRRGLSKNDQSFEGHFNLGDALFKQEKFPEALEQYTQAEKLLKANLWRLLTSTTPSISQSNKSILIRL